MGAHGVRTQIFDEEPEGAEEPGSRWDCESGNAELLSELAGV
jgi:hypothetical protein